MSASEVLVTGGTGALGRRIVERFEGAGVGSRVFSRSGSPGTYKGDLITGEGLEQAVSGVDTIVHCASSPSARPARLTWREPSGCSRSPRGPASRTWCISP